SPSTMQASQTLTHQLLLLLVLNIIVPALFAQPIVIAFPAHSEFFEDEGNGGTSFTEGGYLFTFSCPENERFQIVNHPGTGWNGSFTDNRVIDNRYSHGKLGDGACLTLHVPPGHWLAFKTLHIRCMTFMNKLNHSGSLVVTGYNEGTQVYSFRIERGFNRSMGFRNGFTRLDFSDIDGEQFAHIPVTALEIRSTGDLDRFALDALQFAEAALPVKLAWQEARLTSAGDVRIEWETTAEINNAGFEVQRSTDLQHWQTLGFVEGQHGAQNQANQVNTYSFTDTRPPAGQVYYRLQQKDFDATTSVFEVMPVELPAYELPEAAVYPNPATTGASVKLHLADQHSGQYLCRWRSLEGQLLSTQALRLSEQATATLSVPNLAPGLYLLEVQAENKEALLQQRILLR
ncbi:MAG: T9SS type A sorting domain-containing protein, partial [Bacteroidota bacterium]